MDAIVGTPDFSRHRILLNSAIFMMLLVVAAGCKGKSLIDDNPVFADAPPRGSLSNRSSLAKNEEDAASPILSVSKSAVLLSGNSVVAEVNGTPIFVDDLIGSIRLAVESDTNIPNDQKQQIMYAQIRKRIDGYVEQEIVLQALNRAIPEDRRALIDESLEAPFQEMIAKIKVDSKVETDSELNDVLSEQGLSIDLLRESFVRVQKVQGYLSTLATPSQEIDRPELVAYYKAHQQEFTNEERVRWQEIVVDFASHGGRDGAEEVMIQVVKELQNGADFADVASKYSTALSAEKRGDMGWLDRNSLVDSKLEDELYAMKPGQMTKVHVQENRFAVYRVVDHQFAKTSPFQEVQQAIEQKIKQQRQQDARKKVLDDLRSKATVVTMFDDEPAADSVKPEFSGF